MKWKVEYIGAQANILIFAEGVDTDDLIPVGMGFPVALAERIVRLHNDAIDEVSK